MVCLDSDILINFFRKDKETVEKIELLKDKEVLFTTSINSFEILRGFSKIDKTDAVNKFLLTLKILDFDFDASQKAAELSEILRKQGNPLDPMDLMIASISIMNNQPLLTRNIKHFNRIPGLTIQEM